MAVICKLPLITALNIRPTEVLLGQWIKTAWIDISPESTVKMLKKCCQIICME
jgi:hypothetical protein